MTRYGPGDKVFAKVRGYPPWPARVEGVADETPNKMKYHVLFYGTRETAICKAEELFSYMDHREKFGKPIKKRGFNEGIAQIEMELGLTPKTNLALTPSNTPGENTYDSDAGEGSLVIDETPQAQGNSLAKKAKSTSATTPNSVKPTTKPVKRKLDEEMKSDEAEQKIKGPSVANRKNTPVNNKDNPEVTSRSGRKIKPKKFADDSTEESANANQELDTSAKPPSPTAKLPTATTPKIARKDNSDKSDGEAQKDNSNSVVSEGEALEDDTDIPELIATTPGGQEVRIELNTDRPVSFKNEKAKLQWHADMLKKAHDLKVQIESGKVVPDSVKKDIEEKHHARQKYIEQVSKACVGEDRSVKLAYLRVEAQLLDIDINIKSSLNLLIAEPDVCLRILDELLDLQITPLMLKKHPECVETIKKLRRYIGNTRRWNMTEEEIDMFTSKAGLIRSKAEHIFNKFKSLFLIPEGKTFREAFSDELIEFNMKTKSMSVDEVFGLVNEPTEVTPDKCNNI